MYQKRLVVRTKLTPPRLHKRILNRPRLAHRLLEALDYRLTVVQAGAGFGKSTALAALARSEHPLVWYHLDTEDTDPLVFLLHLVHGFRATLPNLSEAPLAILEAWESETGDPPWMAVADVLSNELAEWAKGPLLLILDDFHLLSEATEPLRILDRLIGRAPPDFHVILSTRRPPKLPTLVTWRVKGEVLEIGQGELAFTSQEIAEWKASDPILAFCRRLLDSKMFDDAALSEMETGVQTQLNEAVAFAAEAPKPQSGEAFHDVYGDAHGNLVF